jgi:hypothetical protein
MKRCICVGRQENAWFTQRRSLKIGKIGMLTSGRFGDCQASGNLNMADSETNGILMLVSPATPISFSFPVSGVFVKQVSTQLQFVTVLA